MVLFIVFCIFVVLFMFCSMVLVIMVSGFRFRVIEKFWLFLVFSVLGCLVYLFRWILVV